MFLEVVAFATDVCRDFLAVAQAHASNLAESRVGLLGSRCLDDEAHAALLRAAVKVLDLVDGGEWAAGIANQLVDRGHTASKVNEKSPRERRFRPGKGCSVAGGLGKARWRICATSHMLLGENLMNRRSTKGSVRV